MPLMLIGKLDVNMFQINKYYINTSLKYCVNILVLLCMWSTTGLFSQTTIWSEDFESYSNGATTGAGTGTSTASWSTNDGDVDIRTVSGNKLLRGQNTDNTTARWVTNPIDISGFNDVQFSFDATSGGSLDFGQDFFIVEYRINGGSYVEIENASGDTSPSDPIQSSYSVTGLVGTTIDFRITFYNTGGTENYTIDNFLVEGTTDIAPTLTATGNQTSCEGASQMIVESISITDPDDTSTTAVYIQISSGYVNGEDLLTLTGTHANITGTWDAVQGELTLTGPATYGEFETAISAVEYSSSGTPTGVRQFSITVGEANFLPSTAHYYEYVPDLGITWTDANTAASARTYFGLQGYLATLTSQEEADFSGSQAVGVGWIGGSDAATEGVWQWVTGPEAGTVFWNGTAGGSTPNFAFWNTGEPNQSGNEDYAHITHPNVNPNGSWNDLSNTGAASGNYQPQGYVVEYGGTPGDPVLSITATTTINIEPIPTITSTTPGSRCGSGTVDLAATASGGIINWYTAATGGSSIGTGTSFVTPSISSTTTYYVDATSNGCTTATRTAVTATINTGPSITTQPVDSTICPGCSTTFTVTASNTDTYQWQFFNGSIWVDLTDTGIYSGTTTDTLTVSNATPTDNGNQYRVQISNSALPCAPVASAIAVLTVNASTLITNRRITYRVDKN
ncbi:hypothetical protein D7Z94_19000 [Ulvibacterium marinum]|uniref:C-type lectin domain-containing protein n=2 Tax=Ulvibacterium marinum TaxID=2419782 RepID=A0A3B0C0S9_9FLAO|nr:hypothetical protein D7Z94_19000 [Ulvibacterium marinum]